MDTEKDVLDHLLVWAPIGIATLSLWVSRSAYLDVKSSSKDNFINNVRDKIKSAKQQILMLEDKDYSQNDKIIINQKIQDLLLYQGYKKEKELFLSTDKQKNLFSLQEEIEDFVSCILNRTDIQINKNQATSSLNSFLDKL